MSSIENVLDSTRHSILSSVLDVVQESFWISVLIFYYWTQNRKIPSLFVVAQLDWINLLSLFWLLSGHPFLFIQSDDIFWREVLLWTAPNVSLIDCKIDRYNFAQN